MNSSAKKYIYTALIAIAAIIVAYLAYSLIAHGSPLIKSVNERLISGNELHRDSMYDDAMVEYSKAYSMDTTNTVSAYNAGTNFLMKNYQDLKNSGEENSVTDDSLIHNRYIDAEKMFLRSVQHTEKAIGKDTVAKANHNLGLSYHHRYMLKEAEAAYKEALRNDPKNEGTRYNLAVVQYLLKQQEQEQQQQEQQDQQQQEQQEQQQQEQQQEQEQEQKEEEQEQEQQQQQQQQQQENKENYDRILDALQLDENELREEMEEKKAAQGVIIDFEKNW